MLNIKEILPIIENAQNGGGRGWLWSKILFGEERLDLSADSPNATICTGLFFVMKLCQVEITACINQLINLKIRCKMISCPGFS